MTTDSGFGRVEELFHRALELPDNERAAFLDRECSDPADRAEVERLLVHSGGTGIVDSGLLALAGAQDRADDDDSGSTIGPYRLARKLGEGGMGIVYEAEQQEPVRRTVALKLIRGGRDTREFISRFNIERQALALMDHPNIARVYDAGATEQGRPYLVMELVRGEPITRYCDERRLDTTRRLELLLDVCRAVHHAHQRGIIHRDLKPSNILVQEVDGRPAPKIIDFGIAKAIDRPLTDSTLHTVAGRPVGTPDYMSPEQARQDGLGVDTRTDVYSLGVLLYELMTGTRPFALDSGTPSRPEEILRAVREDEPPRPSRRLSTAGEQSTEAAHKRGTERAMLIQGLRGDLDWIVMKALEKDRTRRYASVSELAADVQRHLRHEPVLAGSPSAAYLTKKFIRRHPVGVTAACGMLMALLLGVGGLSVGLARAIQANTRARAEAEAAKQVSDFLVDMFKVSNPFKTESGDLTPREILDQGAEKIRRDLNDQPLLQARLMHTMSAVYRGLGVPEQARSLAENALTIRQDALGSEHSDVAASEFELGSVLIALGDYDAARTLLESALATREEILGPEHTEVAETLNTLAGLLGRQRELDAQRRHLERALQIWEPIYGPDHRKVGTILNNLALSSVRSGDLAAARPLYERALSIAEKNEGREHPLVARALGNLGALLVRSGDYPEARSYLERAVEVAENALGPVHTEVGTLVNNLAYVTNRMGDRAEARLLFERSLAIAEETVGPEHPDVGQTLQSLASLATKDGDPAEAQRLLRRSVAIFEKAFGPDHVAVGTVLSVLGSVVHSLGDAAEARRTLRRSVAILEKAVGADHPRVATSLYALGNLERHEGNLSEAVALLERALGIREAKLGPDHEHVARTLMELALTHALQDRHADADSAYARAVEIFEKSLGADHPRLVRNQAAFSAVRGDREAALRFLSRAIELGETRDSIRRDLDLASLHGHAGFDTLVTQTP